MNTVSPKATISCPHLLPGPTQVRGPLSTSLWPCPISPACRSPQTHREPFSSPGPGTDTTHRMARLPQRRWTHSRTEGTAQGLALQLLRLPSTTWSYTRSSQVRIRSNRSLQFWNLSGRGLILLFLSSMCKMPFCV